MLLVVGNGPLPSNALTLILRELLPGGWSFHIRPGRKSGDFDQALDVVPPKGAPSRFAVELAEHVEPRHVDRFERAIASLGADERLLVVAPHLSARSRELLKQRDISYLDSTGNAWLSTDSLLIDRTGSEKRPKVDVVQRPRMSLRGPITGRVVRFLCDTRPPLKVRRIAAETNVNPGNVSRILDLLERERLLDRKEGSVSSVDWEATIERWSTDLRKDRRAESFLEPRGAGVLADRLSNWNQPYAVTGPFASAQLVPVAVPLAIDVYVTDIEAAREALSLRRSERIGNVRLIEAFDRVVFERTMASRENVVLACPTQIAADLLTLPTRSSDEYAELIEWMKRHESAWRR